jgi:hypothetical protein
LLKLSKACKDDNSVPDFVGSQVNDWLNELKVKETETDKEGEK